MDEKTRDQQGALHANQSKEDAAGGAGGAAGAESICWVSNGDWPVTVLLLHRPFAPNLSLEKHTKDIKASCLNRILPLGVNISSPVK